MLVTRIAPTPSGFIHIGNAFNFSYIRDMAASRKATLHLRIDDFDRERCRPEYVQDIFDTLNWLNILPDSGPKSSEDFYQNYSMQNKQKIYWDHAEVLLQQKKAYACDCSRNQKDRFSPHGAYLGYCRDRKLPFMRGKHALRLLCPSGFQEKESTEHQPSFDWLQSLNDFVIWTKEDSAAYQLVSTVEDTLLQTSFIVRGQDLAHSTGAQFYLAQSLGGNFAQVFSHMKAIHHPLVKTSDSQKLSKSMGAHSLKEMLLKGYTLSDFNEEYKKFLAMLI